MHIKCRQGSSARGTTLYSTGITHALRFETIAGSDWSFPRNVKGNCYSGWETSAVLFQIYYENVLWRSKSCLRLLQRIVLQTTLVKAPQDLQGFFIKVYKSIHECRWHFSGLIQFPKTIGDRPSGAQISRGYVGEYRRKWQQVRVFVYPLLLVWGSDIRRVIASPKHF